MRDLKFLRFISLLFVFIACSVGLVAQNASEPRRFAIVVGINQYSDAGILQLQKAQNDAEDLAGLLTRAGGFKAVKLLTSSLAYSDPLFPSRDNIIGQVDQLIDILKPSDQVLFFFSGHGMNDPKTGDSYLLAIDTKAKNIVGSAVNLQKDVLGKLAGAGVTNIIALVDACQKTLAKDKGLVVAGVNEVKAAGAAVVITATGPGKASYEDPKGSNGLFTKALLVGLTGDADLNHDGVVQVSELERWLPDAVSEYAFAANISQKPVVYDTGTGATQPALLRLLSAARTNPNPDTTTPTNVIVPTAKAQFVQLKLPEGVRADIHIVDSNGRELQVISDTTGASPKLEPGNYRIKVQDRQFQYYPYDQNLTVGNAKQTVNLDLKPNFGTLKLTCDPADGVDVLVNGERKGTISGGTLQIDRIKSGSYTVVLTKELYEIKSQTITVDDGKTATFKANLVPNFFTLDMGAIINQPASLFVDGVSKGNLPQTIKLPFRDASIKVVPDDPRYREWTATLSPKTKGSTERLSVNLTPRQGTLSVTTNPDSEAELSLVPATGGNPTKIGSAPLDYDSLIGEYMVNAIATVGGKKLSGSAKVTIREGQATEVKLELKDLSPPPASVVQSQATGASGKAFTNTVGMTFVPVAGGTFTMGDTAGGGGDDEVKHQVSLTGFYLGQTEVTQAQYQKVMGTNPSNFKGDTLPVEKVSWFDAVAFCNKLSQMEGKSLAYNIKGTTVTNNQGANGYRLPTEAEWEYAAKGGAQTPVQTVKYAGSTNLDEVAWTDSNAGIKTHPVAQLKPTGLGLYDLTGNVWEWCQDWYGSYSTSAQTDPLGASGLNRVFRGGGWGDGASRARVSFRDYSSPDFAYYFLGFRVLCPLGGSR